MKEKLDEQKEARKQERLRVQKLELDEDEKQLKHGIDHDEKRKNLVAKQLARVRDSQERHPTLTGDMKINADIAYGDGCKKGQKMT